MRGLHVFARAMSAVILLVTSLPLAAQELPSVWYNASQADWSATAGDSVTKGVMRSWTGGFEANLYSDSSLLSSPSISFTTPQALEDFSEDNSSYIWADNASRTVTWSKLAAAPPSNWFYANTTGRNFTAAAPTSISRSMSGGNIFTSDSETRTMTMTLNIGPGDLTGYNQLELQAVALWKVPEGLGVSIVPGSQVGPSNFWKSENMDGFSASMAICRI